MLKSVEGIQHLARDCARGREVAVVVGGLAAAGLLGRHHHLGAEPLDQANGGEADAGAEKVDEAGDEQGDAHRFRVTVSLFRQ